MKKVFVDSSAIIETFKNNPKALKKFNSINSNNFALFINPIVISEVSYILKKKLQWSIDEIKNAMNELINLSVGEDVTGIAFDYMEKYNMKPNDALIAATCKHYNIPLILTMDSDFEKVCNSENIEIL